MRSTLFALVLILLSPLAARAQPLADRVPDDAIVYVGWFGDESIGSDYDQSHLKAVLYDSELGQVFDEFVPQVIQRIAREAGGAGEEEIQQVTDMLAALGAPMWKRPTAFF